MCYVQRLKETKKNEKEEEKENNRKLHEKKKEQQISTLPKLAINNQLISIKEDSVTESTGSIKSSEILKVPPVESMKIDKSKGLSTSTFNDKMLSLLRMKPHYVCSEFLLNRPLLTVFRFLLQSVILYVLTMFKLKFFFKELPSTNANSLLCETLCITLT